MAVDSNLIVVGQAGSPCLDSWRSLGLSCAGEAFADRMYERNGALTRRMREKLANGHFVRARKAGNELAHLIVERKLALFLQK
jgi:lactam utilization protein B